MDLNKLIIPSNNFQSVDSIKRYNFIKKLIEFEGEQDNSMRQIFFAEAALCVLQNGQEIMPNFVIPEVRNLLTIFTRYKQYEQVMAGFELLIDAVYKSAGEAPPYEWLSQICLNWYTAIANINGAKIEIPLGRAFDYVTVAGDAIPEAMRDNIINRFRRRIEEIGDKKEKKRIADFVKGISK